MAAYVIARVAVTDPEQYELYKKLSPTAVAAAGGRYLARGGGSQVLEGDADERRIVVLEFPDMEAARSFYESEQYAAARAVRAEAAVMEMIAVEGV